MERLVKGRIITIASLVLGILGLVSSYYFYAKGRLERVPTLIVDPDVIPIARRNQLSNTTFRMVTQDGRPIVDDLVLVNAYLFNSGSLAIRPENVLDDIGVAVAKGEILDFRVARQSRDIVQAVAVRSMEYPDSAVKLTFRILEPGDGVLLQLFVLGTIRPDVRAIGVVEGATRIIGNDDVKVGTFWAKIVREIVLFISMIFVLVAAVGIYGWLSEAREKARTRVGRFAAKAVLTGVFGAFVVLFVAVVIVAPIASSMVEAEKQIVNSVPESLRGELPTTDGTP